MLAIFLYSFAVLIQPSHSEIGCRNEDDKVVDWYYLYKLPEHVSNDSVIKNGLSYAFMTSDGPFNWQLSDQFINETSSFPGRTIEPVLNDDGLLVIMYNDEPPQNATDGLRGHSKGVVVTDGNTGFWLIHSVPKFPSELQQPYQYPSTGKVYGQSFLCITVNVDQMELIGQQLLLNEPHVYSYNVPSKLRNLFPDLVKATEMVLNDDPPYWNVQEIVSKNGRNFKSFAKSRHFNKELYADFIAPTLQVNLLVETWSHGAGNLPSDCFTSPWKVMNVRVVDVLKDYQFETLKDHSKWAVSMTGDKDYICVGDINRQEHQKVRGGGSVCTMLDSVADVYRKTIEDVEGCPVPKI